MDYPTGAKVDLVGDPMAMGALRDFFHAPHSPNHPSPKVSKISRNDLGRQSFQGSPLDHLTK